MNWNKDVSKDFYRVRNEAMAILRQACDDALTWHIENNPNFGEFISHNEMLEQIVHKACCSWRN